MSAVSKKPDRDPQVAPRTRKWLIWSGCVLATTLATVGALLHGIAWIPVLRWRYGDSVADGVAIYGLLGLGLLWLTCPLRPDTQEQLDRAD